MGRRQHVPVAGGRRRGVRAVRAAGLADVPGRRSPRSCRTAKPRRSTSATCASTTTSAGSPTTALAVPDVARRPHRAGVQGPPRRAEPGARRRPGWRSCWPPSPSYGDDGWQDYWQRSGQRRRGRGLLDHRRTTTTSAARRLDGDRPLVVCYGTSPPAEVIVAEPPTTRRPGSIAVDVLPPGRVRRRAARHEARRRGAAARRLPRRRAFQSELPLNLFVYPANRPSPCRRVHRLRRRPRPTRRLDPAAHRRQPRHLDRRVDRAGDRVNRLPRWLTVALAAAPAGAAGDLLPLAVRHARSPAALEPDAVLRHALVERGRGTSCGSPCGRRSPRRR